MTYRVLIVDDVEDFRALVALVLELDDRFEVVAQAATLEQALEAAVRLKPDIVVSDLTLAGGGTAVVAALRAAVPDAVLAVLSGHVADTSRTQALDAGADLYLTKGHQTMLLAGVLEAAVSATRRA